MRGGFVGIAGWQKSSFIDYPGTIATVLFYGGCNLRCPYCHNAQLVRGGGADAVEPELIRAFLSRRQGMIEGVVLSGGEPTIHASVAQTAREIRLMGYSLKLDTNGLRPEVIEKVEPDYLALDIKTHPSRYASLLGAEYADCDERLRRSVAIAREMGDRAEIRVTAAPGAIDGGVMDQFAELLRGVRRVYLQPMQRRHELLDPTYATVKPIPADEIERYRQRLVLASIDARIRQGGDTPAFSAAQAG